MSIKLTYNELAYELIPADSVIFREVDQLIDKL